MYVNRYWVERERDEGRNGVYPVYTVCWPHMAQWLILNFILFFQLALVLWKLNYFLHVQSKHRKLSGAILRLIELQRNGETIDQSLVKKVVDSFVSLGLDEADTNKTCLDIYKEHFETPFIDATEMYYERTSGSFLVESCVSDYLKKAEEWLRAEEDHVERYMNTRTRKALISKCEHVLIRNHSELMWDSFENLLDHDEDEDLQRMYSLLSRIPGGLEPLRKRFEEHVKKAGLSAVSKLVGEGGANVDDLDPKAYVDALLEVHRKNSDTVTRSIRGEAGFVASLDKACREFVNRNAATGSSTTKSAELLAKHSDMLLRKNNMVSEEGTEGALHSVVCC
jgi:cullin 1